MCVYLDLWCIVIILSYINIFDEAMYINEQLSSGCSAFTVTSQKQAGSTVESSTSFVNTWAKHSHK